MIINAPRRRAEKSSKQESTGIDVVDAAFASGAYDECRHLMSALEPRNASQRGAFALLAARCAREEDDVDAWSAAADHAAKDHPTPAGRLAGVALRALAQRRAGRYAAADRDTALVRAKIEREPAVAAGLPTLALAEDALLRGAYDEAESLGQRALATDATRASASLVLAACAIARARGRAGAALSEALRAARADAPIDMGLVARTLELATASAAASVDLKAGKRLQRECAEFAWPTSLWRVHVRTLANLRALALLDGDLETAWAYAREAAVRAGDPPSTIVGETNAAVASRLLGEERAARLGLERAATIVRQQRFAAGDDDARGALATFAREAASDFSTDARKALAQFDALAAGDAKTGELPAVRRAFATGAMAHGRYAEVRGNYDAAYDHYRAAFDAWTGLGDSMRAAIVAVDIGRLANDAEAEELFESVLERAPRAWFAPHAAPGHDILTAITPAETLVLGALLGGKSARAIAGDLDRSVHTINNHTRKIFQAFGVTSRAAVLAQCAELGITAKSLDRIV